jgi:hypothetical protein
MMASPLIVQLRDAVLAAALKGRLRAAVINPASTPLAGGVTSQAQKVPAIHLAGPREPR